MWMWPLFFMLPLFAQDMESEKYCFETASKREGMHRELKGILVPADQVSVSGNCLVVLMKSHRRELIQNYIKSHDPSVSITFSSAEIKRDPCRLKVEKVKQSHQQNVDVSGDATGVSTTAIETKSQGSETMQIQTLKNFELQFNQDVIQGECRYITPERYEIKISVRKDPKPLLPPVPAGTVVHVTTPPPDQQTLKLETTVQLTRGSRIGIGSIVRDLRAKNHEGSIEPKGEYADQTNSSSEEIYLSVD